MRKSKKFIVFCALMTLGGAISACADNGNEPEPARLPDACYEPVCPPKPCCEPPVCPPKPCCEPVVCPPKPCCEPVVCPCLPDDCCKRNVCPPICVITPKVDFIKCPEMDFFVTADYILWTAREKNLEFANVQLSQIANPTPSAGNNQVFYPSNKYKSGFKVGLGTDFCHDGWDVYAEYTWFRTNNKKNTGSGFQSSINPKLFDSYWSVDQPNITPENFFDSGSAKWRLHINVVDLELGRNFYVSPRLILRPFYGLKGAWNRQHMNVVFNNINNVMEQPVESMHNQLKNWGIGVRGGMDTSWHITREFSIIGNMAFTGLWEQFKARRFDTAISSTNVLNSSVNMKETQYSVAPVMEWMLGLKWETGLSCDEYHLALTAAWEMQVWFDQNQFLRVPGTASGTGGNLSLQGLTIDARFDF